MSWTGSDEAWIDMHNRHFMNGFTAWAEQNKINTKNCKYKFVWTAKNKYGALWGKIMLPFWFTKKDYVKTVKITDQAQIDKLSSTGYGVSEVLDEKDHVIYDRVKYNAENPEPLY